MGQAGGPGVLVETSVVEFVSLSLWERVQVYSNPSLRICELAVSVLPPKNHGDAIQLTLPNGTEAVTVIAVPAVADAGFGVTETVTPGTATFVV